MIFNTLLIVGMTLDKPLYYVNSMRILVQLDITLEFFSFILFTQVLVIWSLRFCV